MADFNNDGRFDGYDMQHIPEDHSSKGENDGCWESFAFGCLGYIVFLIVGAIVLVLLAYGCAAIMAN